VTAVSFIFSLPYRKGIKKQTTTGLPVF